MFAHYFPKHKQLTVKGVVQSNYAKSVDNDVFLDQLFDIDSNYDIFCHPLREIKNELVPSQKVLISSLNLTRSQFILALVEHVLDGVIPE